MAEYLTVDIRDGIATLMLDERGASVNTVSPDWIGAMSATFEALRGDESVRGVIVTSAKDAFMAGADLKFILAEASGMTLAQAFAFSQRATALHRMIETCGKPVVAAINGPALGGGYELALACTYRILADKPRIGIGLPEVNVGLLPGSGGTQRLPRLIGVKRALEALLEGRTYGPQEALAAGMVDTVVPPTELLTAAAAWLKSAPDPVRPWDRKGFSIPEGDGLLKQSTASFFAEATGKLLAKFGANYPAPISILTCVFEGVQAPLDAGLRIESRHFARLLTHPVSRNIIRTTFVNKGLAEKGVRRPSGVPTARFRKIGVLGAGMMGAGIAYAAARTGIEVALIDVSEAAAERGRAYSAKLLAKEVERGRLRQADAEAILSRIHPTLDYRQLADATLAIEAVFEDTSVKADVTRKAAAELAREGIFASNTSTLPISQLAEAFPRPDAFIGLHFFSPVDRMVLVEVIRGRKTSPETLAHALDFVAQLRKIPIIVNDSRGFYTSRVFQTFIHEGMALVKEGVAPALIENAAKLAGMPVGPLAVLDEVTLDLPMKIVRESLAEQPGYRPPASISVLETMVETLRRSGRKSGGGFYEYPSDGAKRLWQGLCEHFPVAAEQPGVEEVKKRLLYVQAIETVRCLEHGVLTHPADADLGAVYGWGYPTWTGGTLSLIDTVGAADFVAECDRLAAAHGERFSPPPSLRVMAAEGRTFGYNN